MRLRVVASTLLVALTCAGMIALYGASKGPQAVGVGGLPLIKADMSPVKVPPDDTQRDPLNMPNSTIFEALNKGDKTETPKVPLETTAAEPNLSLEAPAPEFAGFRTGFALPEAPAPKKENLFAPTTDKENSAPQKEQVKQETTPTVPHVVAAVTPKADIPEEKEPKAESVKALKAQDLPETAKPAPEKITVPITQAQSENKPQPEKTVEKPVKMAAKPVEKPADKPVTKTAATAPAKPLPKPPTVATIKPKQKEPTAQALEQEELALMNAPYSPKKPVAQKPVSQKVQPPAVSAKAPNQKDNQLATRKNNKGADSASTKVATIEPSSGSVAQANVAPASHYIQLTSAPTEAAAAKAWSIKSSRYGAALGGLSPIYQRVSINGKDYVRLRAGPFTAAEANKRCAMLKAVDAQGGCLVIRQ